MGIGFPSKTAAERLFGSISRERTGCKNYNFLDLKHPIEH